MKKKPNSVFRGHKRLLSFLLIFCLSVPSFAGMQKGKVNIQMKSVSIQEVIEEISNQAEIGFLYEGEELKAHMIDVVDFQDKEWGEVLIELLDPIGKTFKVEKNLILIIDKPRESPKPATKQEKKEIKGTVTDEDGNTLPGVSVVVKGTTTGVATDIDGKYSINIEGDKAILVFSFVGMLPQEIAYTSQSIIDVQLKQDSEGLSEVIIVGYGSARKDKIGSAITQVRSKEIEKRSAGALSIENVLGGQIKGLNITQSSGKPGASSSMNIRGITSPFASGTNQPLFVIDGVAFNTDAAFDAGTTSAVTENPLLSINPDDIETVSVLKDAAATAIYGSRGANGVIIVTTKRGVKNANTRLTFSYGLSMANPIKKIDLLDAKGFRELHNMMANNSLDAYAAGTGNFNALSYSRLIMDPDTRTPLDEYYNPISGETVPTFRDGDTDWQDEIYRNNAITHNYNIGLSGGSENTNYSLSISHADQEGMIIREDLKRYGIRLNIDSDVNKYISTGASTSYSAVKNSGFGSSGQYGPINEVLEMRPDVPLYDENGDLSRYDWAWRTTGAGSGYGLFSSPNPVLSKSGNQESNSSSFFGNAYMQITPMKGLKLKASINASQFKTLSEAFTPIRVLNDYLYSESLNSIRNSVSQTNSVTADFQINYEKTIGDHAVNFMGGYSEHKDFYSREYQAYQNTPDDYVLTNANAALIHNSTVGGKDESGINSFYSRMQYSFSDKYTATLNFRTDKSSKFGPGNQRAYFPSVALNWNIVKESFMQEFDFVDKLSLRASLGRTGSANVNNFAYLQFFEIGRGSYGIYDNESAIIPSSQFPNPEIKWETTTEHNIGLDFAGLSHRIYGSLDFYRKYTKGVLTPTPIFLSSGATQFNSNLTEISNTGAEFEIGGDIIRNNEITWSANLNIAFNRNRLEAINGTSLSTNQLSYYVIGEPVGVIRGFEVEKIYQTQAEVDEANAGSPTGTYYRTYTGPGDYKFKDVDGDGRITSLDYKTLGSMQPDYFGGFSTNFNYKGFTLFAGFNYSVGNEKQIENFSNLYNQPNAYKNMHKDALTKTWTPDNTDAKYSRLIYGNFNNRGTNNRNIQDASYLRFKTLRLSYELPAKLLEKVALKKANIYVSGSNLYTWTKYEGVDPEGSSTGRITGNDTDVQAYPFARTFTFGVKLGF